MLFRSEPPALPGASFSESGGGEARFAAAVRRSPVAWERTGEAALDAWTSGLFFGAMVDEELDADLLEYLEADEDETSACAPYLARQMSCLGSQTSGVKDNPFLGSVWGAKEAEGRLPQGGFVYARGLHASKHHRDTRSLPRFRPPEG